MSSPRVLVVEDEPALSDLAELYLGRDGFAPEVVTTGEDALTALTTGTYAVVLLDIGLPGAVDGVEVCRRMRAAEVVEPDDLPFDPGARGLR